MPNRKIYHAMICIAVAGLMMLACNSLAPRQSIPQPTITDVSIPSQTAGAAPSPTAGITPSPTAAATRTQTPAPTPTPRNSPHLVGYFAGSDFSTIPGNLLTDVIYAFVSVSAEGRCGSFDPARTQANSAALKQLKEKYPGLHVLFSIGGGGLSNNFSAAAASELSRQAFVGSCMQVLQQNGFDGIDIDWEFPGKNKHPEDRENFPALLAAFRKQLNAQGILDGRAYLLTITAPSGQHETEYFDLGKIQPSIDWVNLMTYVYYDERSKITNLNAALYPVKEDPGNKAYNADAVIQTYRAAGIPAGKIMVGTLFYGQGWKGVPAAQDGLYQPANGPFDDPDVPKGTWNVEGNVRFQDLERYYLNAPGWKRFWQPEAQAPWLYNAEKGAFITYDDAESLEAKTDYVVANHLAGVMIWEIDADDANHTLLKALAARLLP